ncbi:heavy-metal-associated domain-containing protein [Kineococcus auxinigenes]|uniref:heavy-metal-associated domain-containing protein n=1 Tax=unclassified Kineococcus TaxID=2621656 RepID=UPI003D7E60F8
MNQQSYEVTGMTCQHCVNSVRDEVGAIDGVTSVDVALVAGGTSTLTVTSSTPLDEAAVAAAVDEAGYELAAGRP